MKTVIIEKGTKFQINGIPFEFKEDTEVLGIKENLALAKELNDNNDATMGSCCENP